MATKNIQVISADGTTATLNGVTYGGVDCDKVYARASVNDEFILVFDKGGSIVARIKISAGNQKMNLTVSEAASFAQEVAASLDGMPTGCRCIIFPAICNIGQVAEALASSDVEVGVQRINQHSSGAYTGQVSAQQANALGAEWALVGQSECRAYLGDTDSDCGEQANAALTAGLNVIFCVGENLTEREAGQTEEVLTRQLDVALGNKSSQYFINGKIVINYEPIWAIGTGKTCSPQQAQEACAFISEWVKNAHDVLAQNNTSIIYGGSMNPTNAGEVVSQPDIDGGCLGGVATNAARFVAVTNIIFNSNT